jgi:hypothetical protein
MLPKKIDLTDTRFQILEDQTPKQTSLVDKASALGRGAVQGLSFGFADELSGLGESAFTDKTYEQARDESRAAFEKAQAENPELYLAGEIGGAVLPAFLSGGTSAVASGARTAGLIGNVASKSLLGMAGRGAIQGGLQGLGESESTNIGDIAKDTALGVIKGGATGGAFGLLSRGGSKIVDALPSGATLKEGIENRIISPVTGLTDEGVDVLRQNPKALTKIESLGGGDKDEILGRITEDVRSFLQKNPIKQSIDENYAKAYGALEQAGVAIDPSIGKEILDKKMKSLGLGKTGIAFSDTDRAAQAKLAEYWARLDDLSEGNNLLSATDIKQLVGQIRNDIKSFGSGSPTANDTVQQGLKELQAFFDTTILKENIPEFKQYMLKVARDTKLAETLDNAFITRTGKNYDINPNKIKNLLKGEVSSSVRPRESEITDQLSKKMQAYGRLEGDDAIPLRETLENLKLKQIIEGRSNQGSNLVNYGTGLGAALGGTVGGLIGGTEGAAVGASLGGGFGTLGGKRLETESRKLASKYFERQANQMPSTIAKFDGTKYAPVLKNAAERGTRSFAVANYLLQQQDPEYRERMGDENE